MVDSATADQILASINNVRKQSKNLAVSQEQYLGVLMFALSIAQELAVVKKCCEDFEQDVVALTERVAALEPKP